LSRLTVLLELIISPNQLRHVRRLGTTDVVLTAIDSETNNLKLKSGKLEMAIV